MVTVNPSPAGITGSSNICTGVTPANLGDATSGGTWTSSNNAEATITPATGLVSGVNAGSPTITYTLPAGCFVLFPVTVNTSPAAITGAASVCSGLATNLVDATTGGVWSSNITAVATVNSASGVVTGGVSPGTATISYTISATGCAATTLFTVNPTPSAITGVPLSVCAGVTAPLGDATTGGVWSSNNTALATVLPGTGSGPATISGVSAGNPTIIYTLPAGCFASTQITVNTAPAVITGVNNVCAGLATSLGDITGIGTWSSSNPTVASVGSASGIVTGGAVSTTSTVNIFYTLQPGSCTATFPMTVNFNPANITGTAAVCINSATNLGESTTGGVWSSSNTALATVTAGGSVNGVGAGTPLISYTLPTGCNAIIPVVVNPLPSAISGILTVCTGASSNLSDATTAAHGAAVLHL